ncbi:MAG: hypothetical protein ABI548_17340 [Polyangiaceae bacterium]
MLFRRTHFILCGTLLAVGVTSSTCFALSDEERAGARAAANQGADDFDQGKWAEAVDMFSRAEAIVHSPIHLSYIARSQLKLGQWVEAYELFNRIKREQPTPPVPAPVATAIADAPKQLAKLDEEMPSLILNVKGADPTSVSVTMDGVAVPAALIGLYHPVNPGVHRFRATSASASSNDVTVDIKPSSRQSVDLVLSAASAAAAAVPVPAATTPAAATPAGPPHEPATPSEPPATGASSGNGLRVGGYVALGVGVVGVGLGTVFLLAASSKQKQGDDAFEACGGKSCPVSQRAFVDSLDSNAASGRTLAFTSFLVGGIGAATGITLFVLAGKHGSSETTAHVEPWIGYQSAGLSGSF